MDPCPIVFGVDEGYVEPMLVTIVSLAVSGGVTAENGLICVMHCGIPDAAQERIVRTVGALGLRLQLVELDPSADEFPVTDWISPAAYLRLRISEALPDAHRALYLDADLISVADISELLTLQPAMSVAAVRDVSHPRVGSGQALPGWEALGLDGDRAYFNSGVLVIDLVRWRSEQIAERASEFLIEHSANVRYWDQDALNVVLDDRWERIPPEWNVVVMSHFPREMLAQSYSGGDVTTLDDALALEGTARILHFAGPFKPWAKPYPENKMYEVYSRYREQIVS